MRRALSMRDRLAAAAMLSGILVGSGLIAYLPEHQRRAIESGARERLVEVSTMVATFVAPGLDFQDSTAVHEVLRTLTRLPEIRAAEVRDRNGRVFASFGPVDSGSPSDGLPGVDTRVASGVGEETVIVPVEDKGVRLGTLVVTAGTQQRDAAIAKERWMIVIVAASALAASWILAFLLGSLLSRPFRTLEAATMRVAAGDFTHRVPSEGGEEIRRLAHAFNRMTARLQATTTSRDLLEREVQERIRAIDQAERMREKAEAASRVKSEFLARMSHEVRTPMNGILGMLELNLTAEAEPVKRDNLQTVHASALHLLSIINDVLDFSKIEAGHLRMEPVPTDLPALVESILQSHRVLAEQKGLELRSSVIVPARYVRIDPVRLRQVLSNLLGNAIKFTDRGSVCVSVSLAEGAVATGRALPLRFEVEDTGIGIPRNQQELVFEAFRQVDGSTTRRHGGTGLGLTIARQLAGLLGGRLALESEPGVGSRFWFDLTVPVETVLPLEPVATSETRAPDPGLRILVAEDNPVNQKLMVRLLTKAGHEVTLAGDGKAAVTAWERGSYDVVLMDWHMPEMNGLEATAAIRKAERGARVPIVALTASAMEDDRAQCLAAGMDDYLAKPIRTRDLLDLLARITGGAGRSGTSSSPSIEEGDEAAA